MKKMSKAIWSILIVLMLFNFAMCSYNPVFADESDFQDYLQSEDVKAEQESSAENKEYSQNGIIWILGSALNFLLSLPGVIVNALVNSIGRMAGKADVPGSNDEGVGLYHIFFNKLGVTDINILDKNNFVHDNVTQELENAAIVSLRENIANWYYGIRNLAIAILLLVLIYVGIRMAISTVAEEQAKYKTMLKDWFVALILVFVLQYIAIFFINMNNVLVDAMDPGPDGVNNIAHYQSYLYHQMFSKDFSFTQSLAALVVYSMLAVSAFGFLYQYIKRMIHLSFLLLIAPIITVTYPIDKMGDGKAQALNKWLEEFAYGILIQPFHCLLFLVFVNTSLNMMSASGTFSSGFFAVFTIIFMYQAEGILKTIFGLNKSTAAGDAIKSAATILAASNLLKGRGKKNKSAGGGDSDSDKKEDKNEGTQPQIGKNGSGGEGGAGNAGAAQTDAARTSGGAEATGGAADGAGNINTESEGQAGAETADASGTTGNSSSGGRSFTRTIGRRAGGAVLKAGVGALKYSFALGAAAGGLVLGAKGVAGGFAAGMGAANAVEGGVHKMAAFKNNHASRRAYNAMSEADRQETLNNILSDKDGSYVPQTEQQRKLTKSIRRQQADLARLGYSKAADRNKLIQQSMERGAENKQIRKAVAHPISTIRESRRGASSSGAPSGETSPQTSTGETAQTSSGDTTHQSSTGETPPQNPSEGTPPIQPYV